MFIIMLILYLIVNLTMIFTFTPMIMMMLLVIQIINLSIIIGLINKSFWFSYILFLILIGGLMILFIYMSSMISNNMFNLNIKYIIKILLIISILFMSSYFLKNQIYIIMNMNYSMFNMNNNLILLKIYNNNSINWIIFMMNYLFFSLIIMTKIINLSNGPLRSL